MKYNGARAKVYLKFNGTIEELSKLLSKGLIISDFFFDTNEDPPHEVTGQSEALGFSIWLNKAVGINGYDFVLELETNMCLEETFNDLLCDISPWLSKYISEICDLEVG